MILSRGHKLRYANQFVGAFILLVVGLLFVGMVVLIRSKNWLTPKVQIVAYLPEDELNGLQVNTPVQILGERVGKVTDITYETKQSAELEAWWSPNERPPTQFLRVDIEVAAEAIKRLGPMTPRIYVRRRMAGVGDVYLELMRGRDSRDFYVIQPEKSAQDEIRTMTELMGEVQRDFEIIRQTLERSSANFDESNSDIIKTSQRVRELSESLLELTPKLPRLADSVEQTSDDMRITSERVRKLSDSLLEVTPKLPQIAESVERTSEDMRVTSERFRETTKEISQSNRQLQNVLSDAEEVSPRLLPIAKQTEQLLQTSQVVADRLKDESESLPGTVNEFRDTMDGFQDTVGDAQEVIDGLRQNWLIRRHVDQPEQPSRVSPSKVRVGGFIP
jgi:ABC-type transporter Mla subunit MlaD